MATESNPAPLIVIVGETASGKTAAGIKVAQQVGGEIICADSRTVYKQMDIGTAKPTKAEQKLIPHHLVDIIEPNEKFSAADFKRLAQKCIQDIHKRGKVPIIVGGTGLYIDAVLYDFQFQDKADPELRAQLLQMSDEELTTLLHTKNINTPGLNTKNRRHVVRAIERGGEAPHNSSLRENTIILGLRLESEELKGRVEKRVDRMFQEGLAEEANNLFKQYGTELEAFRTPGYKAIQQYLIGAITEKEAKAEFVRSDLHLAKRQRTWFKRNPHIEWFGNQDKLTGRAVEFISDFNYN